MKRIHFIAIGGSAMHNLAIALHKAGYIVSGSDDEIFEPSRSRLSKYGLLPENEGWFPEKLEQKPDAVILGMHARKNNPELLEAQKLALKIYSYPEYLYRHSAEKTRIVIGGSHGKTTTTAMVLHALHYHNIDTDFMVGAQLDGFDTMVSLSEKNKAMIMEGDEYLTSPIDLRPKFHVYKPHIAVITGIAWDHMNVFPTYENYLEQFRVFIRKIIAGGTLIYNAADDEVVRLVEEESPSNLALKPYNLPDYEVTEKRIILHAAGKKWPLQIYGQHNLLNLEAAKRVAEKLDVNAEGFYEAMQTFRGASGRMEILYEDEAFTVIRDFAHAPSKLKATVEAVKETYPERQLTAVMELHTYSSLNKNFLPQYSGSMQAADEKVVFYTPHTLAMKKLPELSPEEVKSFFDDPKADVYTNTKSLSSFLSGISRQNRVLLLMSSGSFGGIDLCSLIPQDKK
ncbi:MAG: UDP-N-acetylmuramate--L-alanine ligase [Bacteroidota bacterium]